MTTIATVTGSTTPEKLGKTLMHEHLVIGYPGWESHTTEPGPKRADMLAKCVARIEELKANGFRTLLDPCPNDLGRDVSLAQEVAARTGFQIIVATGLYKQEEGGAAYWHFRNSFGDVTNAIAELFIREIEDGVGETGVRAGIIKLATGRGKMTDYERQIFTAAAKASVATGAPITTHTDGGTVGDLQQQLLTSLGVPAHRIVIGHSCGTSDHAYHLQIARGGSYLGFDRFGIEMIRPDAERVKALVALIRAGAGDRVVVSHDSVWCWRGMPFADPKILEAAEQIWNPLHFTRRIAPQLKAEGVTDAQLAALIEDNPRRFFAGQKLAALA
ncbi:MAG TPA: phosphotriesterase-related protein [Myxococcota bacterium]|nr:phosphotriesterase-related protein [Myxococcota bacterium]